VVPARAGVWLVDKPAGPTSHDIVAGIRRGLTRGTKVGHAGTLDPFATGLLVVLTGRATRLTPFLTNLDKTYLATVQLGQTSASGDPEGPIAESGVPPALADVEAVLPTFVGEQKQRVPALSAVKVGGERLYAKVRRGEEVVETPERDIVIHRVELQGYDPMSGRLMIEVHCGKGTYLRQLASDIGERLGCGGYCGELRRTAVGHMRVADAVPPVAVAEGAGIGLRAAMEAMEAVEISADEVQLVEHGRSVPGSASGQVLLVHGPHAVAVAEERVPGLLHPSLVLVASAHESVSP
jgi:tRNA pseudouridine55 synthase